MFDSVYLLATALNDLQDTQEIAIKPLSCEKEETSSFGSALTSYMQMVILWLELWLKLIFFLFFHFNNQISSVRGMTGEIKFDDNGLRTDVKFHLFEITRDGFKQVGGHWEEIDFIDF